MARPTKQGIIKRVAKPEPRYSVGELYDISFSLSAGLNKGERNDTRTN